MASSNRFCMVNDGWSAVCPTADPLQVKTDDDEAFAMCRSLVRGWAKMDSP